MADTSPTVLTLRDRAELEVLFDTMPAAIAITRGPDHRFELTNKRYLEIAERSDLVGRTPVELRPDLAGSPIIEAYDRVYQTGVAWFEPEHRSTTVLGTVRYTALDIAPRRDPEGAITGLMLVAFDVTAQVLARQEAAFSAQRFAALSEAFGQMVFTSGPDGVTHEDAPQIRAFTGMSREDWLAAKGLEAVHPDDRERVIAGWRHAFAHGGKFDEEYRLRKSDGTYAFVQSRGVPVVNPDGTTREWVGVTSDISSKKDLFDRERAAREEAELHQSKLRTTLHSIGDAVIATDPAGVINFINPIAEALTGWAENEARGRPLRDVFRIVHEKTRKPVESPVDKVIREGVVVGLANHTVLVRRDGGEVAIDDSGAPIRDEAGKLTGVVLVFRDVTAKKREEEQREFLSEASHILSSSLGFQTTLTKLAQLAVPRLGDWCAVELVDDTTGDPKQVAVAHVDPAKLAFAEELGRRYPPDPNATTGAPNVCRTGRSELYPEIPRELLLAGAKDAEHLKLIDELRLRSAMVVPLTVGGRTLGAMTFVFAETSRTYDERDLEFAEDLARRAAVAVDNARLFASEQRARESADRANRAKDDFLATVSHELRTPLNAMLGWTRLLRGQTLAPDQRERALETIERNAVNQAQLIEDLLDVSRIISGKLRLDVQTVELSDVVLQTIDALRIASEAKGMRVVTAIDQQAGSILGDPNRLQQVVWNLISNAIKFTPKNGVIHVILERVDSSAKLSVSDNGPGIGADFLPYVFDRFKQAEGGITRKHGGLGLGLSISRQLVELHGGTIEVQSSGEGKGATFIVTFPLSPLRADAARASSSISSSSGSRKIPVEAASAQDLAGLDVLVVDDEEDARELLVTVLEGCGARVRAAPSVERALAEIAERVPQVLLSDIGMPVQDGYDLIRRLRALPAEKGGTIPAAALTAYARVEDRRRVLNAGFMMHVPKPVEPAELVAVVASLARFAPKKT